MNSFNQPRPTIPASLRLLGVIVCLLVAGCHASNEQYPWRTLDGRPPIIIAHRGDSGNYPEHSLIAYQKAMDKRADFVEFDVVLTKDGVPVCRHDLYLSTTTDVASRAAFADRKRVFNGRNDWFVFDFTYQELKTLTITQPVSGRGNDPQAWDFVPTLERALQWINYHNNQNRWLYKHDALEEGSFTVGAYIELKHPGIHRELGLDLQGAVLGVIEQRLQTDGMPPIIYQCFDRSFVRQWIGAKESAMVLLSGGTIDFDEVPKGTAGLGLNKKLIDIVDGRSPIVEEAHRRGLFVHVWTFRDDQLNATGYDSGQQEIEAYLRAGVDGVFTDFPATGVAARQAVVDQWVEERTQVDKQPLSSRVRENSGRRFLRRH